ncbi:hypothetical protein GBF35_36795 [Nonomuraea phyllanthi]|uniref:hypothetical protein n=1 Tax=Nonomuraea phyllanthi TaxID=2219224 RepID=UPI0012937811|nr:hypothetical protein [Nonomuraea phyllanthi]QFY11403.1 hypothetical protein GBF35_36795 [Nonomuraea phyllanthi]
MGVLLLALALPGPAGRLPISAAERAPAATVDGVEIRYLPPSLGTPYTRHVTDGPLHGAAISWGSADDLVRITVYRHTDVFSPDDLDRLGLPRHARSTSWEGYARASGDGSDLLWIEQPGFLLRVTAGRRHIDDVRPIAGMLRPADPPGAPGGVFEGLRLGYLPEGVQLRSTRTVEMDGRDYRTRTWAGPNNRSVTLTAEWPHGRTLTAWARKIPGLRLDGPTWMHGKAVHPSKDGSARVWEGPYGQIFALTATGGLQGELDRIVAGVR